MRDNNSWLNVKTNNNLSFYVKFFDKTPYTRREYISLAIDYVFNNEIHFTNEDILSLEYDPNPVDNVQANIGPEMKEKFNSIKNKSVKMPINVLLACILKSYMGAQNKKLELSIDNILLLNILTTKMMSSDKNDIRKILKINSILFKKDIEEQKQEENKEKEYELLLEEYKLLSEKYDSLLKKYGDLKQKINVIKSIDF